MEQVYFSAGILGYIPAAWKDDGTYTDGSWPKDAVLLTDDEAAEFWKQNPPDGKSLGSRDGRPAWVDIPPRSKEELISEAAYRKAALLGTASTMISTLQDAVDLDMATDQEVADLKSWKVYRVLLSRIDTSTAPDIEWLIVPE